MDKPKLSIIKNIQWWILLMLIFTPKIVINAIPGLSSALRVDLFLSLIYFFLIFVEYFRCKSFLRKNNLAIFATGSFILFYVINSNNVIVAFGQVVIYLSLFVAFVHGLSFDGYNAHSRVKILIYLLLLNIVIHLVFYFFGIMDYVAEYEGDSGVGEVYTLLGRYGISGMPFQFAIYIVAFIFLLAYRQEFGLRFKVGAGFLSIMALLTGDSRITLGAIFVAFFGLKSFLLFTASIPISMLIDLKALSFVTNFSELTSDPSLLLRLQNFDAYLNWLSFNKLLFGGGAQVFLEFSMQYGVPGPLDMGYVRVASEIGLIGLIFLIFLIRYICIRHFIVKNSVYFGRIVLFLSLYFLLNEGLLAARSGHLIFFVFGLLCFHPIKRKA